MLSRYRGRRRLVILEGLYSMDGDLVNLAPLVEVAERHTESRSRSMRPTPFWPTASAAAALRRRWGSTTKMGLIYGTFSKATAGLGGFVVGPKETLDYLRLFSHPYAFSCALPPHVVAGLLAAVQIGAENGALRTQLHENAEYFRRGLHALKIDTGASTSQVVPVILGARRDLLYHGGLELLKRGLFMAPVDFPAVPEDAVRFRASITAAHTRADLDEALNIIEDIIARPLRAK